MSTLLLSYHNTCSASLVFVAFCMWLPCHTTVVANTHSGWNYHAICKRQIESSLSSLTYLVHNLGLRFFIATAPTVKTYGRGTRAQAQTQKLIHAASGVYSAVIVSQDIHVYTGIHTASTVYVWELVMHRVSTHTLTYYAQFVHNSTVSVELTSCSPQLTSH